MPEIPIFIPLIVAGFFLGSAWTNKDLWAAWKRAILASAISGLLNAGYVWVLTILKMPVGNSTNSGVSLLVISGLGAFLIVLAIYLSAVAMIRYRRGKAIESEE